MSSPHRAILLSLIAHRKEEETAFGVFRSPNKAARRVAKKGSVNRLGGSGQVDQSGGANGRRSARTWTGIGWKQESDMAFSQRHRRCVVDKGCGSHALGWIGIGTGAGGWLTVTESQVADHEQQSSVKASHINHHNACVDRRSPGEMWRCARCPPSIVALCLPSLRTLRVHFFSRRLPANHSETCWATD